MLILYQYIFVDVKGCL